VLEPGPLHGYAIIQALRAGSDGAFDLPTGAVCPELHRLERAGLSVPPGRWSAGDAAARGSWTTTWPHWPRAAHRSRPAPPGILAELQDGLVEATHT
jgi:hypothetical protein